MGFAFWIERETGFTLIGATLDSGELLLHFAA
jgi:hypothetical protein